MRRRPFFIATLTAIITFVSLQAFVGNRYHGPYAWHRWHRWNHWNRPYDYYGPALGPDTNYQRYPRRWNNQPGPVNTPQNPVDSAGPY